MKDSEVGQMEAHMVGPSLSIKRGLASVSEGCGRTGGKVNDPIAINIIRYSFCWETVNGRGAMWVNECGANMAQCRMNGVGRLSSWPLHPLPFGPAADIRKE